MTNQPIKNNSKLLYLQARYQFEKAKKKFEDGSIKTESKLIQEVFQAFRDFFISVGKPMMIPRYAIDGGPPWSKDYNDMMDEIRQDLELLYQEVDIIGRALYADFNHNVVQHTMLQSEYNQVADKLKDLELLSSNLSANGRIVFCRNDFANKDKIDFDRIVGTPAHIENGAATLKRKSQTNQSQNGTVTIVPGNKTYKSFILGSESNGFPGNNAEITVSPDGTMTGDYIYRFVGEKNNHGNYGAVLDGDANSWFEYELVNVRDHDKQTLAKNLGWDYQVHGNQTLRWARDPENGVLKLHMQVVLPEVTMINHININMYTPPNHGAKTAIVKDILVSDGTNAPVSILSADKRDEDYSFYFAPVKAKVISFLFEQSEKYYTDIGHIYYEQKRQIENGPDYVFDTINKQYTANHLSRVEGPMISLQDLGISVRTDNASIDAYYAPLSASDDAIALDGIISNVSYSINDENIDMGIERFEGWRYCIGIRDIEVFSTEYEESGEIVTEPYYFDQPLDKITLDVVEEGAENLEYYISIDDGANWFPITPISRQAQESDPPKIYTIQLVDKASQKVSSQSSGYIETEYPVYSVRLRVLMTRPTTEKDYGYLQLFADSEDSTEAYGTPILRNFVIKAYVQDEAADSEGSGRTIRNDSSIVDDGEIIDPPYFPPEPVETDPGEAPEEPEPYEPEPPVDGVDPEPNPNFDELNVRITNKTSTHCHGDVLYVNGIVDGPYPITKAVLLINGEAIDEKKATRETNELSFNFRIPTSDYAIGDSFAIEVKGYDSQGQVDADSFVVSLKDCSIPPEPEKVRNCLQFDMLVVQYFNEDSKSIENIEIPYSWLPYEIDNGNGDKITFAWNRDSNGLIVMVTESYDTSGQVFNLSSVGINYLDEYNESVMTWATAIAAQSNGAKNTHLMIGAPDGKDTSWMFEARDGNYDNAPAIGGQNDYIIFRFSEAFNSRHCPINHNFKPSEHNVDLDLTKPPIRPYDPENGPERSCLLWDGVIVQYYHPDTDQLERVLIPVADLGNNPLQIGRTKLMIGWSEYFNGVTVQLKEIREGAGDYNGHITGIGIKFTDYYGDKREVWAETIAFASEGIMNYEQMVGEPKEYSQLTWIPEIKANNFTNAPCFTEVGQYVAFKYFDNFTNNICPIDSSKQNDDDIGIDPGDPPDRPKVYIEPFPYDPDNIPSYCYGDTSTFRVKGYAEDFLGLKEVRFHITQDALDLSPYKIIGSGEKRIDFDFDIPISSLSIGEYRVTGWATNIRDLISANVTTRPNKPFTNFNVIECSVKVTLTGNSTLTPGQSYMLSGVVNAPSGVKSIKIWDNLGNLLSTLTPAGGSTRHSFDVVISTSRYSGFSSVTFIATAESNSGMTGTAQHTVTIIATPPTIEFVSPGTVACANEEMTVSVGVRNTNNAAVLSIRVTDQNGRLVYSGNGANGNVNFNFKIPENTYPAGQLRLTAEVELTNGATATKTHNVQLLFCSSSGTVYACGTQSFSGGSGTTVNYHNLGTTPGRVDVTYDMYDIADKLIVRYNGQIVAQTDGYVSNTGTLSFNYVPVEGVYHIEVTVIGPSSGTSWNYRVLCPQ